MNNLFTKIVTDSPDFNRLQDNITKAFSQLSSPFLGGNLLQSVSVKSASPTTINHGLGRTPQVWVICDQNTNTTVKRTAWNDNSITLQSGSDCVVSLWVN